MGKAVKSCVAPIYLLACLILGGSAQAVWQNMLLQLAGLGIIAWAAASVDEPLPIGARSLLLIVTAGVAVVVLQLIPLPAFLWAHGLRSRIAEDYVLLGQPVPQLPLSLTPYDSLNSLLGLIPPIAMFCAILCLGTNRPNLLATTLLTGAVAGIALGALQLISPGKASPWYLYPESNRGHAVGFFANANHMADLLVVALPFVAALAASGRSRNSQRYAAVIMIGALVMVLGIVMNGSLAASTLAVPAMSASILIVSSRPRRLRMPIGIVIAVGLFAAVAAMASTSVGSPRSGQEASAVESRQQVLKTTREAIYAMMPFGSGLGSFGRVYPLFERVDHVTPEYATHANNDYAELILELGVGGALMTILFFIWWAVAAQGAWRVGQGGAYARAASIASAVILVQSLADFPLRTAAMSASFAMCLALMIDRHTAQRHDPTDLRPTRHLVVD